MSLKAIAFLALFIMGCSAGSVKYNQYYAQGEVLYQQHCANCHQVDGSGLGLVYPPLNESDFMDDNIGETICGIKHGINGEITVNGDVYNQPMPGVPQLTDLEIAEIATFIYNSWEHSEGLLSVDTVRTIIMKCDTPAK